MRPYTGKLRGKFIFACTIWTLREKEYSVTICSSAKIVHYTSGILVKIMHLSQLFFHMLTLKALTKLNATDR